MTISRAFSITCVTCGCRLKVPHRDLIGSIDSCPKCGAMVEITEPSDFPNGSVQQLAIGPAGSVDSDAITQSAVHELHGGDPVPRPDSISPTPPPQVDHQPAVASHRAGPNGTPTAADQAHDYRHEVEGVWQNQSTQRTKQIVLVSLLSVFGLIAAGVVFSQFVRSWQKQTAVAAVPQPAVSDTEDGLEAGRSPAYADAPEMPTSIEIPPVQVDVSVENVPIEPTPAVEHSPADLPEEPLPVDAAPKVPPLVATPFDLPPTAPFSKDPLMVTDAVGEDSTLPMMTDIPPEMRKHLLLLNLGTAGNQAATPIQAPPNIDTVRIEDAAADEEPVADASPFRKTIEVEKQFAQRFAIDNSGDTLAELMLLASQWTTVPIGLELISLDVAGVRVDAPIKTPSGWLTARQWLDDTCAANGLETQPLNGSVMLTASDERINSSISAALNLADFGDQAANVFQWLSPIVQDDAPEPVAEGEEPGAAFVTVLAADGQSILTGPSLKSRLRAVLGIEAVRLMRGMPAKLERWQTSRWLGPWPMANIAAAGAAFGDWPVVAQGQGGNQLDSPRAAAGLLKNIAGLNQKNILVDWYDAMQHGLYPADPVMPYSKERTASGMLDEMLGEQGLQTRVCGPSLWYVCSEARYDRFDVIAWYAIPPGSSAEIRARLVNSLSIADTAQLPIAFEDERMLIRCPRFLARQMVKIIEQQDKVKP